MKVRISLDHTGIAAIAKSSEIQHLVESAAHEVAGNVSSQNVTVGDLVPNRSSEVPLPVEVETSVSDRARANVILAHPAGAAVQAKYGALTKAASAAGLDVRGR